MHLRRISIVLAGLVVLCAVLAGGSSAASTNTHFKVAYWGIEGVYWTCNGVHKVPKTGPISDNETCTTPAAQGNYGPFVAGTYQANELYFGNPSFPGGCGAITPALPGSPGNQTFWISDAPGFGQCDQFFTITYAPTLSGGWSTTINATY